MKSILTTVRSGLNFASNLPLQAQSVHPDLLFIVTGGGRCQRKGKMCEAAPCCAGLICGYRMGIAYGM